MTKKKKHIDTYETPYDVHIVIANEAVTLEDLRKKYKYCDNNELDDDFTGSSATTARCEDKVTGRKVVLVKYNRPSLVKDVDKKLDFINTISHEALHVALDIYAYIGQDVDVNDNESLAYLVGWIGECIYKTWTKK